MEISRCIQDLTRRRDSILLQVGLNSDRDIKHSNPLPVSTNDSEQEIEEELRRARVELLEIQHAIQLEDPEFATLRGVTPATLEDVESYLDQESVLVAYFVTVERILIFVVTQNGLYSEHVNLDQDQLTEWIQQYRDQLVTFSTQERDMNRKKVIPPEINVEEKQARVFFRLSRQLYRILVEPIEVHLRGKSRIGVIPHDVLHLIPFQALRDQEGYLLERFTFWYIPSLSFLDLCFQRQRRSQGRMLALGNPELGNPDLALP